MNTRQGISGTLPTLYTPHKYLDICLVLILLRYYGSVGDVRFSFLFFFYSIHFVCLTVGLACLAVALV
ncbi:hypothetical protein [Terrilactibacillus tamarindi]|uniref:hypothetical protein n=1 Tax=Terrilactibacillus tamarindi TaxID=2599694 RepID=UPI0018AD2085|nr:hypothetical protein [Terrilactibacillus tamarindi]